MKALITILLLILSYPVAADFVAEWDQATAQEKMKNTNVIVIDVRSPEEYAEGHVPGAINIPHNKITEHKEQLAKLKGNELLLYCRSGRRAGWAEETLTEMGVGNLYHLKGDMQGWQAAGLKIEK